MHLKGPKNPSDMLENLVKRSVASHFLKGRLPRVVAQDDDLSIEKKAQIETYLKTEFGLGRETDESFHDYVERAHKAVHRKEKPLCWLPGKCASELLKNARGHDPTTRMVQQVTEEFLGIRNEPLDAYIVKTQKGTAGFTLGEPDNSGVIGLRGEMEFDYDRDMDTFSVDVARYLTGRSVEGRCKKSLVKLLMISPIGGKDPKRKLFKNWLSSVYNNHDLTGLHEGIHNIDGNSKPSTTDMIVKEVTEQSFAKKVFGLLPGVRHFRNYRLTKHSVDFESSAFKVSIDAYIEKSFNDVRRNIRDMDSDDARNLYDLEQSFYDMSSTFSKRIIKTAYLQKKKLCGAIQTAASIGVSYGLYALLDQQQVDGVISMGMQGLAYLQLYQVAFKSVDALPKVGLYHLFGQMTNRYVDSWNTILRTQGIVPGFQNMLGKHGKERVRYARSLEGKGSSVSPQYSEAVALD